MHVFGVYVFDLRFNVYVFNVNVFMYIFTSLCLFFVCAFANKLYRSIISTHVSMYQTSSKEKEQTRGRTKHPKRLVATKQEYFSFSFSWL